MKHNAIDHPVPPAALERHIAILGKTGSGKTFAAKGMVERLCASGAMVVVLDPTGAWWGLGLNANGNGASTIRTIVVGGEHGHIPLPADGGKACAELVAHRPGRADLGVVVFDVGLLTVRERTRWAMEFGEALYRLNQRPLHLVIDEAHCFAPQGRVPDPESGQMLHAFNQLASGGRSRGIRITMITQRPAKLHKDTLTSAGCLVAMQVLAPQDRKAIKEWIDGAGDQQDAKAVMESLASLEPGEGWVWYPDPKQGVLRRTRFPAIATYDSSATPTQGTVRPQLPPADLDQIRSLLGESERRAAAEDPAKLRKRVSELEAELKAARSAPLAQPAAVERQVEEGLASLRAQLAEQRSDRELTLAAIRSDIDIVAEAMDVMASAMRRLIEVCKHPEPREPELRPPTVTPKQASRPEAPTAATRPNAGAWTKIGGALRWWERLGHTSPTRVQVAHITDYSARGGTFRNLLSECSSRGLIRYAPSERLELTDAGRQAWPALPVLGLGQRLDSLVATLSEPGRRIVRVMLAEPRRSWARERVAEATGYEASGGTFRNLLSELHGLGVLTYDTKKTIALGGWLGDLAIAAKEESNE